MTVISNETRHWLLIYRDGKEMVRWATKERSVQNRMENRRSRETALYVSFLPRFTVGKYESTTNKITYEDLCDRDMLKEVFKTRKAIRGNLEYVYVVL